MPVRWPSFWGKIALIATAVAVADVLLWNRPGLGANLGLLTLSWTAGLALANPAIRRSPIALVALGAAGVLAALQIERPTAVGLGLYVVAMGVAALGPRAPRGDDGWRWAQRLVAGAVLAVAGPFADFTRLRRIKARTRGVRVAALLMAALLPLAGGLVFLSLFAAANPVIAQWLSGWRLPRVEIARLIFWGVAAFPLWASLRPRGLRRTLRTPGLDGELGVPGVGPASVATSLGVFNAVFALQNGLDIAYLWRGAGLPSGVSFSAYAHQGAEPLIATALLAGLFVLVFLRPGSTTAASRPIRALVIVWVLQNLFLVASTALRTWDYVQAYSLTPFRIAAMLWMALVAAGLVLILWRLLAAKSSSWLINANLLAAGAVLALCSVVDLSAVAAAWNVRHAREAGGEGVALDLCYMRNLSGGAIVSLAELEQRPLTPGFRDRVAYTRRLLTADLARSQAAWRGWRWRDARRLQRVRALTREAPVAPDSRGRDCQGLYTPPPAPRPPVAPLTPSPNPGTR
jgi:hypothetical protein